jgi:hypothetical protein
MPACGEVISTAAVIEQTRRTVRRNPSAGTRVPGWDYRSGASDRSADLKCRTVRVGDGRQLRDMRDCGHRLPLRSSEVREPVVGLLVDALDAGVVGRVVFEEADLVAELTEDDRCVEAVGGGR